MKRGLLATLPFLLYLLPSSADAQAPGDLDPLDLNIVGDYVLVTAVQPDGKTIVAGSYSSVLGVPRQNIARLNADGTLDMGFDPKTNGSVYSVAVQADGKILLGGWFTTLQPNGAPTSTLHRFIARVNADGTLDMGFDPRPNGYVFGMAVQADGKVLFGGWFSTLQPNGAASPTARQYVARVNGDGTLDVGFDPKPDDQAIDVAIQPDGKVLLGGRLTTLQPNDAASPTSRLHVARLEADGTLDTGFDPKANGFVQCFAVQPNGKVLLGGSFTTLQPNGATSPAARQYIARVNADGTLDTSFDPKPNGDVYSIALQADGKALLGGAFTTFQPNAAASATARQTIARINTDGTLDAGFDPKANHIVNGVAIQADGKVLLGGQFTTLQPNGAASPITRNRFARLYNNLATQVLSSPDRTRVLWERSGSAPEISRVIFEASTDGGASWIPLGAASRISATANWELTGLGLPSCILRARGLASGGYWNASSVWVEATMAAQPGQPIEAWRQSYFGTGATNNGNAADTADADGDGLTNLDEYARNTNPLVPTSNSAPIFNAPTFTFTRNIAATDISFRVEATDTLFPAAWAPIATRSAGAAGWTTEPGVSAVETDAGVVTITDSLAPGAVPQRFLHVALTRP
jgi:uncharacterized delta-60 repeat protein